MPAFNQTLNLDSIDTVDTSRPRAEIRSAPVSATTDASPLFPAAPVYARTPQKKASSNLALLVGAPVVLIAAGALAWSMMASPDQAPALTEKPAQMAVADTAPLTPPLAPAAMPAPEPVQTAVASPVPLATAPARLRAAPRATAARRAAPAAAVTAPDATTASANVSATVPAPAVAPEPAPIVIAAPVAPTLTVTPVTPIDPQ
ncbi:hypothetical protein [Caulobacter sp. DWR1-3-2b1]|uniref:hypothetical protein n=1 Tax=Caulobacter sp. DWR1-3-2b1 TaxID=2804670 RepID=UPI003CF51FA3